MPTVSPVQQFRSGPLVLPVRDEGPRAGDVVVLLHGFPQDPSAFDQVAPLLHGSGLRTLAPALRGYAPGARPTSRRDYTWTCGVEDLVALLDAVGADRAHLVGHDWGGILAWAAASWQPQRVRSLTVLSTPHPAAFRAALFRSRQALQSWYMLAAQVPATPELVFRWSMAGVLARSGLPEPYLSRYARAMADPAAITGALGFYRGMAWSWRPRVGRVHVPTTYVWGRHDFALSRAAAERTGRQVAAAYRFAELDGNHWLPETLPDLVAAAVLQAVGESTAPWAGDG